MLAENVFEIHLPTIGEVIELPPTKEAVYDRENKLISVTILATTTEDLSVKIPRIQASIRSASLMQYVKDLYISRLQQVLVSKDPKNLVLLQKRVDSALADIDRYAYSPILKGRYAKLKQGYVYISYLLR